MIPVQQLGHLVFLEFLTVLIQGFGFLLEHGCTHGQGYLFDRPLSPDALFQRYSTR